MPTYQYACTACGAQSEVVQKFTDDPLTECGVCHGRLRKVFSAVGIVFKGPGFYRTDSRAAAKQPAAAKANGSDAGTKTPAEPGAASASKESGSSQSSTGSGSNGSSPSANGSSATSPSTGGSAARSTPPGNGSSPSKVA